MTMFFAARPRATPGFGSTAKMTAAGGNSTFCLVLAKDPNRRKSRSGARAQAKDTSSNSASERNASSSGRGLRGTNFVLYVEGPRDREILECWARRVDPGLSRCIEQNTVILGGRRPARAIADFRKRGGVAAGYSGLIVLDRDDHAHAESGDPSLATSGSEPRSSLPDSNPALTEAGLELFVWSLRHIESYLLVPAAIRRMLRLEADDRTVERIIERNSMDDTTSWVSNETREQSVGGVVTRVRGSLHAKRVLGAGGSLSEALGAELRAGDIARAMRIEDLHSDVRELFDRIGMLSGRAVKGPEVVIRQS
jgi:hypothetical protein